MKKKYKIIWSPKALKDLDNIHFYIEYYLKERNTANNVVKRILDIIATLNYLPERYAKVKSISTETKDIHKILVNNYIVIYDIEEDTRTSIYFTYFSW